MSPSSSRRRRGHGPGVFDVSFTTSWETVSTTSSHSSSYILSLSSSSSTASASTSSGYIIGDINGEHEQHQSTIKDDTTQSSSHRSSSYDRRPSPNFFRNSTEGCKLIHDGEVCSRCRTPLVVESSSSGDNNNKSNNDNSTTGVCIACEEEEFERKLVEFAAIHAKKTSDEDDEDDEDDDDDDDDESNDNRYDEFVDDDDDADASSSCSSYSKHVSRTRTVVKKSVKFGNLPRRGREEDDVKVVVMDDSNILSYQANGASMNIEVTLAPPIDKSNNRCQGNSTTKISLPCNNSNSYTLGYSPNEDFPSVDLSVLAKEEFIPNWSREEEEEGELQQSMTEEETEECGREKDDKTSSSGNLEQSNNHVQKLEARREKKFDDGIIINLIPPPLLKKTMAAVQAAKEALVLSKTAAWHKVCLNNSPKHHEEEKLKTPQTSNTTVLAAAGTDVADASTFNESHDHSTGVVVEDREVNEYEEEENVMYMKPQSSPSEQKCTTTDVQCNLINEERNPINERDNESQQGSRTGSVQSSSVDCERDEVGNSNKLNSSQIKQDLREMSWQHEIVEDGNDSIAPMITLDELCISKQELIRGSPLENAAENVASLIRHSSNIKADLPPSVAKSVIVKSLIAKFWRENSQVKHNQQSSFQKEFIGEKNNNVGEQKSQKDPTTKTIRKDQVNGDESLSALSDDKHQIDDTTSNGKSISQQLDPLSETSTHLSGIDPPYETGDMRMPKYCLASSVTDPPYETSSLPVIDPPDGPSATNLRLLSSERDPPEESEPIINFTALTESVSSHTYMGVAERYCKPDDESFYSEDSFYSKWRKIRYDAMSTVKLHSRQDIMLPNNANDIRSQLAQLEFKFSQSSIRENDMSSVIPIAAFSTSICDKPMDPPSSISESMSNKIFSGALDKMNTLDDYLRLIDVSHNRQRPKPNLPLSPTAAARRQRYKEKLIEEKLTRLNRTIIQ